MTKYRWTPLRVQNRIWIYKFTKCIRGCWLKQLVSPKLNTRPTSLVVHLMAAVNRWICNISYMPTPHAKSVAKISSMYSRKLNRQPLLQLESASTSDGYYAAFLPRRGRILRRTLSVCLSVRPSVPLSDEVFFYYFTVEPSYERTSKIEKTSVFAYGPASRMYFSARAEGRISYGHLGRKFLLLLPLNPSLTVPIILNWVLYYYYQTPKSFRSIS